MDIVGRKPYALDFLEADNSMHIFRHVGMLYRLRIYACDIFKLERLTIDSNRIRSHIKAAAAHILAAVMYGVNRHHRHSLVLNLRKTEKYRIGQEILHGNSVTIQEMRIFIKVIRSDTIDIAVIMLHDGR